jgi:hypothetical protein
VTSYMTTAGTHYSTTKKRTAINHCLEIERLLQQIKISAAVPASVVNDKPIRFDTISLSIFR